MYKHICNTSLSLYIYIYTYVYTYVYYCHHNIILLRYRAPELLLFPQVGEEQRETRRGGPDHPEGENISRGLLDFSARAGLHAFPYETSLRIELRSPNVSEKIQVLQPPPSSAHRVPPIRATSRRWTSGRWAASSAKRASLWQFFAVAFSKCENLQNQGTLRKPCPRESCKETVRAFSRPA